MYSVFLVEDEIVTREGIRNSIPWESTPYALVGEAPDGEIALPALRDVKPDILITDIKMPFMDGLALARIIKRDQPWIKIIILSGHDEFDYAKEAISIGVEEYLLKPITSQDMIVTLEKVARQIEKEKTRLTSIENLKMQIKSSEEVVREKWLGDLITGQIEPSRALETARRIGMDLDSPGFLFMIVQLHTASYNYRDYALVRRIIDTLLAEREDFLHFPLSLDKQVILVKNLTEDALDDTIYTLAQGIKFETERNTGCLVSIGIGSIVSELRDIVRSYTDADRALRYMAMTGRRNIVSAGDLEWTRNGGSDGGSRDQLYERFRYAGREDVEGILASLRGILGESFHSERDPGYQILVYNDICATMADLVQDIQGNLRDIFPQGMIPEIPSGNGLGREEFESRIRTLLDRWIVLRDSQIHTRHHQRIREAKKYIDEQFRTQDLSLNSVAGYVNLSPNHFSTVFSQEAGETFIEYLTGVRIRKAKELLVNSSLRSAEITFEVGYSDPHYFSYIFKKHTGMSPREYRMAERGGG